MYSMIPFLLILVACAELCDAATVVDVYRLIQYDIGGVPFGSRLASLNHHAGSLPFASNVDLARTVVILPVRELNLTFIKGFISTRYQEPIYSDPFRLAPFQSVQNPVWCQSITINFTMEKLDANQPIRIILDGSNYVLWAQAMRSFLKGHKLWRYITGDISEPTIGENESKEKLSERLEDWDSKNHRIITWFHNTCSTSISSQLGRFECAKAIWDFLAQRYTTSDLSHQYQLLFTLHRLHQDPGESINSFISRMQSIWDQLAASEPTWTCTDDIQKFILYRDKQRIIHFLMALNDDFEPIRASLLHRNPLPTL